MNKKSIFRKIFIAQLGITLFSICVIALIMIWEIPQRDFPETMWWSADVAVRYWPDIFFPVIQIPIIVFVSFAGLNILGTAITFFVFSRRRMLWRMGFWLSTFADILLFWVSIVWVHSALISWAATLRYGGIFLGGWKITPPESWQVVIGAIASILLIAFKVLWERRFLAFFEKRPQ